MSLVTRAGSGRRHSGHHRAFGLLSRGITRVPAYVWDVATAEDLAPAGTLPRSAWQGDRPPLLRDYPDDLVAEPLLLPVPSRTRQFPQVDGL